MFKKGQLVKLKCGIYGIIETKSVLFSGEYRVSVMREKVEFAKKYFPGEALELIGNNFKFKGAK